MVICRRDKNSTYMSTYQSGLTVSGTGAFFAMHYQAHNLHLVHGLRKGIGGKLYALFSAVYCRRTTRHYANGVTVPHSKAQTRQDKRSSM